MSNDPAPMHTGRTRPCPVPRRRRGLGLLLAGALPLPGVALNDAEIKQVFAQAAATAQSLGVNAVISLVDREGNLLGCVRTNEAGPTAPATVTISAGGSGGLEGVVLSSLITTTSKAGTAAFLSTSGNAFSTRTAGFIIQEHFPANIQNAASGPLFGVQLSNLPTSDLNRLPLGLAADPGGLPLYRSGQVVAGIGAEVDGLYTAPASLPHQSAVTEEELIAAGGCAGFPAPSKIRGDNILVGGVRFAFSEAPISSTPLAGATDFDTLVATGRLQVLAPIHPTSAADSIFVPTTVGKVSVETVYGFQQGYVEAVAVRGEQAFIVTPDAELVRSIDVVNISTGARSRLATISGLGNLMPAGDRVSAMTLDDRGSPVADDDLLYVYDASAKRVLTVTTATGTVVSNVPLATPGSTPRDAIVVVDGGVRKILEIPEAAGVGGAFVSLASNPGVATAAPAPNGGVIDSIATGESGTYAIARNGVNGVPQLLKFSAGAFSVVGVIGAPAPGTGLNAMNQTVGAMAYNNAGTPADTSDDRLVIQNSATGRQFSVNPATAAIVGDGATIANARFVLGQARATAAAGAPVLVGISNLTRQLERIAFADPTIPGNLAALTGIDATSVTRAGVPFNGQQLTNAEVMTILTQAQTRNAALRAAIRRDSPQRSQVTVSVSDRLGNLLGVVRTPDAPIFGFDVSLQKARSANFMCLPECGTLLTNAGAEVYVQAAQRYKIPLDGSIALSETSLGYLARPLYPDGIGRNGPGPFCAQPPNAFSPFNTGMQVNLLLGQTVRYLTVFAGIGDDAVALQLFDKGLVGTPGTTDAAIPLPNGIQIFAGSVPLYKNNVLVGGVGVSGDGIEQDADVAYAGGQGFQQWGPTVKRADQVISNKGLRLPYVKFPRNPSGGL